MLYTPSMFESVYWKKLPPGESTVWDPELFPGLKTARWNTALQAAVLIQARTDAIELSKNNHKYFFPDHNEDRRPALMRQMREELIEWICSPQFALMCEDVQFEPETIRDHIWSFL